MEVFMSKTNRGICALFCAVLLLCTFVCVIPAVSADTAMGGMETNVPDTDIGGATGGAGDLITVDPKPESSMPESETRLPATDTVTTPVTTSPEASTNNSDDGLGWLGIVICVAVIAAIIIVVVALLPKKKTH